MTKKTALGEATSFALRFGEMAMLTPFVFAAHSMELFRTASGGGNVGPRLTRLAAEKQRAAIRGAFDATAAAHRLTASAARDGLLNLAMPFALATAAMEPARVRVRANARRLSRGK